jgi:hypothetical protein
MENPSGDSPMKQCPHCQKEISAKAKRCPYCQADLRSWPRRHPIWTTIFILIALFVVLSALGSKAPATEYQTQASNDSITTQMAQNDPTIKQLGTFPTNYVGKSFTLYVYAEDDRYYNYGFDDENNWYSLKLWDNSVGGDFEGVYAYLPKTAANKELVDKALNGSIFIKVEVSVPTSRWQDNSNAFLQIDSWSFQ